MLLNFEMTYGVLELRRQVEVVGRHVMGFFIQINSHAS
jgi:hypothetical protein